MKIPEEAGAYFATGFLMAGMTDDPRVELMEAGEGSSFLVGIDGLRGLYRVTVEKMTSDPER